MSGLILPPPQSPFVQVPPFVEFLGLIVLLIFLFILSFCLIKVCNTTEPACEPDDDEGGELLEALDIEAPVFRYDQDGNEAGREKECVICLSGFEKGEEYRKVGTCGHVFHRVCIDRWFKLERSCPLCRTCVCVVVDPMETPPPLRQAFWSEI